MLTKQVALFVFQSDYGQTEQNCKAGRRTMVCGTEAIDHEADVALASQSQESQDRFCAFPILTSQGCGLEQA
jgi:hypothetical protein